MTLASLLASTTSLASGAGVPALDIEAPNGSHNVLIPSMHMGYANLRQPTMAVLQGAKVFVVEHVEFPFGPTGQEADISSPLQEDLQAWIDHKDKRAPWAKDLTEAEVAMLRKRIECISGIPEGDHGMTELWLSVRNPFPAMIRAHRPCGQQGLQIRDAILQKGAESLGIHIEELESMAEIWRRRAAIPTTTHLASLHYGLDNPLEPIYEQLVAAINAGDFEKVQELSFTGTGDSPEAAAYFKRVMVEERNAAWLLHAILNEPQGQLLG